MGFLVLFITPLQVLSETGVKETTIFAHLVGTMGQSERDVRLI